MKAITKTVSLALSVIMVAFLVLAGTNIINLNGIYSKDSEKTICLLMKSEGSDFWNSVMEGAEAAGKENGYRIVCRGPEAEDPSYLPKQLEIAESLLSEKPVGIAMATLADGFGDYLKKVSESDVAVIQYDSGLYSKDIELLDGFDDNPLSSYVKADNYANAALVAEKTYEAIKEDIINSEEYVVGVIQHENSETAALRSNGFKDKMNELVESDPDTAGKVQIIVEVKPSPNDNAYKAGLEFLYEKNARMIYGTSLNVTYQLFDAIQAAGNKYDEIKFVGYDTSEKIFDWIKMDTKAEMIGAVDQNPYMIGKYSVETLIKIDKGEQIEEEILVPGVWYNRDNID